jgi:hypothetical protein
LATAKRLLKRLCEVLRIESAQRTSKFRPDLHSSNARVGRGSLGMRIADNGRFT